MRYLYIRGLTQSLIPLVFYPIFLAEFGSKAFTDLVYALSLGIVLSVIVQFGFNISGHRDASKFLAQGQFYEYIMKTMVVRVVLAALLSGLIAYLKINSHLDISNPQLAVIILIMFSLSIDNMWVLEWRRDFHLIALISILSTICLMFESFTLSKLNNTPGSSALFLSFLLPLPYVINSILSLYFSKPIVSANVCINSFFSRHILMHAQLWVVMSTLVTGLYFNLGIIIMKMFMPPDPLSQYLIVEKISLGLIGFLCLPLTRSLRELSSHFEDGRAFKLAVRALLYRSIFLSSSVAIGLFLILNIFFIYFFDSEAAKIFSVIENSLLLPAVLFVGTGTILHFNNVTCVFIGRSGNLVKQNTFFLFLLFAFGIGLSHTFGPGGWFLALGLVNLVAFSFFLRNTRID
jgi:PST family polysaccharide transporter